MRIGELVTTRVAKNLPDKEAYLCYIGEYDCFGLLPRGHALKKLKVGDLTLCSVIDIYGARVTLSQKIPQFVKMIILTDMKNLLLENKWEIKRAVLHPPKGKVIIKSLDGEELDYKEINKIFIDWKKNKPKSLIGEFFKDTVIYLIPWRNKLVDTLREAFRPGPIEIIKRIETNFSKDKKTANIYVSDPDQIGFLYGTKKWNLELVMGLFGLQWVEFIKE